MPTSREVLDGNVSRFHCTTSGCTYSNRDACGIVLHMRTHFVYETAEREMPNATFISKDGIFQCFNCNRKTNSQLSFREHVRHHILPFPYRCHCGTTVASIPDLRRHSNSAHPKTPLQMHFEDAEQLLDNIFSEIGPLKRTFWFPQRIAHDSSSEVENLLDTNEANVCSSVLNESNVTDIEMAETAASRISVLKANAEPRQKENCCKTPSTNVSKSIEDPSSTSASVLEFSTEYNYINAFSYSTTIKEPDSSGFCVLNVPDYGIDESRIDSIKDIVQGNLNKPESLPIKWQWLPQSKPVSKVKSFKSSLTVRKNVDSRNRKRNNTPSNSSCLLISKDNGEMQVESVPQNVDSRHTARDNTPSISSCSLISKDNGQMQGESESELLTVFSRVTEPDSEVLPSRTESEPDLPPVDEPAPPSGPGKFVFCDEKFKCLACLSWETASEQLFKNHVWQHFHGISKICNNIDCQSTDCPLVLGMAMLVKSNVPSMDTSEYPLSSTPTLQLSDSNIDSDISSNRSALESLREVEISSPTDKSKMNSTTKAGNLIQNLTLRSAEKLRFSAPTLDSLRSKACRHLHFNSELGDLSRKYENLEKNDRENVLGNCVDDTGSTHMESDAPDNICAPVSGEDSISPRRRKQMLSVKPDANQPVEYCRYPRDSTPLSTACDQCSYTCNCSVQLRWHVDSCHPEFAVKKKKEFCCTECGFSDNSKDTLIWHMAHHIGEHTFKIFACKYCSKQSTYMCRVMKHVRHSHPCEAMGFRHESTNIAYMDGIFKCPFCSAGYPWGSLFFRHIELQHKLKKLAEYLAHAYHKKCCPEVIEFPKHLISESVMSEISKDNQSLMDKNTSYGTATPYCTEVENVSKVLLPGENPTESSLNKNYTETDDRAHNDHVSQPDAQRNSECTDAGFSSAQSVVHKRSGDVGKYERRYFQKSDTEMNSEKLVKNLDQPKGNIFHVTLRPNLTKSAEKDIIYNSTKRKGKKYVSPKGNKRSFLISPACVPTLPRNVGNNAASDFEKSLPNEFIFSQPIKCPKCYYTDRIRLNLIRHYNGHLSDASKGGETSEASNIQANKGDGLSFDLWNPKKLHVEMPESNRLVTNKRKNQTIVSEETKKEHVQRASKKGKSKRGKRDIKRARLTDEVANCNTIESQTTSLCMDETANSGSVISIDDSISVHSLTSNSDTRTTSTPVSSTPAFGQFLQNHANKIVSTMHRCESCSSTFTSETEYEKHAKDAHSSTYYVCRSCGTMIRSLSNVHLHFKENHPGSLVLVDEWVSTNKESKQRVRPFSEVSDVGLPAKKPKMPITDDKRQLPEKSNSEREDSAKGQKWSSFYGANLRKQHTGSTVQIPATGTNDDESSTLNTTSEVSLSISSQTTCTSVTSMTCNSIGGGDDIALGVSVSKLKTNLASHSVTSSSVPPPFADNNNLFATFMTNLFAANLMRTQTVPVAQMQSMGTQIPSSSAPLMMAGSSFPMPGSSLPMPGANLFAANLMRTQTVPAAQVQSMGIQIPSSSAPLMMAGSSLPMPGSSVPMPGSSLPMSGVDASGFANLLASLLMANLAAGTGMTLPTPYPNQNTATPVEIAYPFQSAANNLNLLGTGTNPQHEPPMPELQKIDVYPKTHSIGTPGSAVSVQNDTNNVSKGSDDMPDIGIESTLVPGESSVATEGRCLDSDIRPMYAATSGSKTNRSSAYDNLYSSEAESSVSCVSQRTSISRSSASTTTSKRSSRQHAGRRKKRKNQFFRYDSEKDDSDFEICSSVSSISTVDLRQKELRCNDFSPWTVSESFVDQAIRMCCNMCEYKTRKLGSFERHLESHFASKQPSVDPKLWKPVHQKCGFCNFKTYLDEEFEEHVATHTIKKPFQCGYCSFSGFTKESIDRHLRKLHPELEPKVKKNQNLRLKQTVLHNSVTKVSLHAVVKLRNVLDLSNRALKRLCNKYQLVKLHLREK